MKAFEVESGRRVASSERAGAPEDEAEKNSRAHSGRQDGMGRAAEEVQDLTSFPSADCGPAGSSWHAAVQAHDDACREGPSEQQSARWHCAVGIDNRRLSKRACQVIKESSKESAALQSAEAPWPGPLVKAGRHLLCLGSGDAVTKRGVGGTCSHRPI